MNCIIIDDEQSAIAIIDHLGENNPKIKILETFQSAINAIKYLNQFTVDLIFLDFHMPMFTGLDFIKTIKNPPRIIMTTSDKNFALQAFEYDCIIDYFVKPVTQDRFDKGIEKAILAHKRAMLANPSVVESFENPVSDETIDDLYVSVNRRLVKIDIPSIHLIMAKGDYILLKTANKNYMVHSTLKKIEDKLPQDSFLKVHRSYVINTKKIIDIEDNSVLLGKDVVPVSRTKKSELMRRLNLL